MLLVENAETYIARNVIDIEDWIDSDALKKERILSVSYRILNDEYADLIIPEEAYYEYAAALSIYYNDTNRLNHQGIAGFSITGVASFTFDSKTVENESDMIPKRAKRLIEKANNVKLTGRIIQDTVL